MPQESRLSSAGVAEANTTPSPRTKEREATQMQKPSEWTSAEQETHDHLNSQFCTSEVTLPSLVLKDLALYTKVLFSKYSSQPLQPLPLKRFYGSEPSDSKLQVNQYRRLVARMEKLVAEVKELQLRFSKCNDTEDLVDSFVKFKPHFQNSQNGV